MTDTTHPQQAERRDRYAAAIRETDGWVLDGGQHMLDAVMAVADAELLVAAAVPASAPTDQAALRSDLEDALKGAGVYDSKERMWHSLSPEWIEEILTEVLAVLPAPAACPDPIECSHEAALGQAQQEIRRLGLMVDEYGHGASALTHKLKRVRDLHRETCILARGEVKPTAFQCGMCELLDAPASGPGGVAGETQQDETQAQPPRHRWAVEIRDGVADEWAPGTRFLNRHHAVERYEALTKSHPTWKDGAPVERRLVRETVTYTVEQPAAVSQPDEEA
jgi:hypothetical protein